MRLAIGENLIASPRDRVDLITIAIRFTSSSFIAFAEVLLQLPDLKCGTSIGKGSFGESSGKAIFTTLGF